MRVAYLGNFRFPWCTEVHIARDLEHLGHEVVCIQEPDDHPRRFGQELLSRAVTEQVGLVLYTRTWGLPRDLTQTWRALERKGIATASYHLDLYVGLRRQAGVLGDPFWTTGHVFTPDGDPASEAWFAQRGIRHHWSPPAVVSDECVPGVPQARFAEQGDVVFVGSQGPPHGYHREWPWRTELLDYLESRYGARFKRYASDVDGMPTRGQDLNDLYATATVVVGDSLCLPGHTRYWSDRYYETVGRGGFLVGPHVPGIDEHLTDGVHLRYYEYGDLDAIGATVDYYLDRPDQARAIATRGQAHVRAHHTYQQRLAAALTTMGLA